MHEVIILRSVPARYQHVITVLHSNLTHTWRKPLTVYSPIEMMDDDHVADDSTRTKSPSLLTTSAWDLKQRYKLWDEN